MKKILTGSLRSVSFWLLLAGNIFCFIYYKEYATDFATVLWIYWCQSVCIGIISAIELYLPAADLKELLPANDPNIKGTNGCLSLFFMVHYGIFHLVYLVFIAGGFGISINKEMFLLTLSAFIAEAIMSFYQRRKIAMDGVTQTGLTMFLPYLRILPMHLTIILPAFMGVKPTLVFIVLKTVADMLGWIIFNSFYYKRKNQTGL